MHQHLLRSALPLLLMAGVAAAQSLPPGPGDLVGQRRGSGAAPALPAIAPAAAPQPTLTAPPPPAAGQKLSTAPAFVLRAVRVEGNTVLDQPAIDQIIGPHLNKPVSLATLEDIRWRLTELYLKRGYINSGVTIPDQNVENGIVVMRAVEGRVTEIDVKGAKHFRPDYFRTRLARGLGTPFNIADIEREQQILLQDPLVRRLNIELQPGLAPGEAKAEANVLEANSYAIVAQIANDQSPTVGEVRGQLAGTAANLFGVGDILFAQYGRSRGINDGAIGYSLPLFSDDTRLSVRYDINGTVVVTPRISSLNLTSHYDSVAVGLSRPFYRDAEKNLTFGTLVERRAAQTFLLGMPFSFVAGADNGRTNVTAWRLYGDYLDRNADHAFALRSTLSVGLHALGATVTDVPPTGEFVSWLTQAQYVRRLWKDWEAVVRSDLQLSSKPLFPIEQFALGGLDTVRGYRQYLTVTDDAFFASGELRIPVWRLRVPHLADSDEAGTLQIVPFYDFGRGWNVARPTLYPAEISGVGAGLRWLVGSGIIAEIYYARPLRHVAAGTSLEDRGIYFRLTAKLY